MQAGSAALGLPQEIDITNYLWLIGQRPLCRGRMATSGCIRLQEPRPPSYHSLCTQWKIMKTDPSPDDSPFKTFTVEQNLWSWFLDTSLPSPDCWPPELSNLSFSNQHLLLKYWLSRLHTAKPEFNNTETLKTDCYLICLKLGYNT